MCIFSTTAGVSNTQVFARQDASGSQVLVYEMDFGLESQGAMILPVPVHPGRRELKFVDLSDYEGFFAHLDRCFPELESDLDDGLVVAGAAPDLIEVQRVGSFQASFVPRLEDFHRLDPVFRLPENIWKQLPSYRAYGFAVFKFAEGNNQHAHPMAFRFAPRFRHRLFFPTVHVHDGQLSTRAWFDHALYAQAEGVKDSGWQQGIHRPSQSMMLKVPLRGDMTRGLVDPAMPVWRRFLNGSLENEDTWLRLG